MPQPTPQGYHPHSTTSFLIPRIYPHRLYFGGTDPTSQSTPHAPRFIFRLYQATGSFPGSIHRHRRITELISTSYNTECSPHYGDQAPGSQSSYAEHTSAADNNRTGLQKTCTDRSAGKSNTDHCPQAHSAQLLSLRISLRIMLARPSAIVHSPLRLLPPLRCCGVTQYFMALQSKMQRSPPRIIRG